MPGRSLTYSAAIVGSVITPPSRTAGTTLSGWSYVSFAPDAWDIRLGYGMHECIGKQIGDEIMVRTLAKILELKDLKIMGQLEKQWGWIVKSFEVSGTVP